ncbi:SsgA family sporulation/cell division regulator [Streptomyces sp. KL116D]|uniref:SsgA family sporulation/cell division regulator n=1 Tax=Streptomyces sp. KL116D TaxID=3045152 RepID=UPI0035571125
MEQHLGTVTCPVTAHVRSLNKQPMPLPTELHYRVTDPYAVRISLGPTDGPRVPWVFARDLLVEGLHRPTGAGDVLVLPAHGHHPDALRVVLKNGAGTALVELAVAEVAEFLRRTYALVPAGTESDHLNLDSAITALMGRSPQP